MPWNMHAKDHAISKILQCVPNILNPEPITNVVVAIKEPGVQQITRMLAINTTILTIFRSRLVYDSVFSKLEVACFLQFKDCRNLITKITVNMTTPTNDTVPSPACKTFSKPSRFFLLLVKIKVRTVRFLSGANFHPR